MAAAETPIVTLDKTGYTDFKKELPDKQGAMISVIQFNDKVEGSNTFSEYTGKLAGATTAGVGFQEPSLFFRFVSSGTTAIPLKPSTEYYLKFFDFYTYMWTYTGGDTIGTARSLISPTKGGKSRRKRKSRKSKLKYRKNGTR